MRSKGIRFSDERTSDNLNLVNTLQRLVPWRLRRYLHRVPILGALQRRLVANSFSDEPFVHQVDAGPAKGVRFWVQMPEDKGIWTGNYEYAFAERLARAVRPGDVCFDVGGWHGFFSGVMAASGASAVYTFEPLPENIQRVAKLIELNPSLPIELIRGALSNEVGETDLVVMPDTSMAKLSQSKFQSGLSSGKTLRVRTYMIDELVQTGVVPAPSLMKLDVEGAEWLVLQGAMDVLRRARPHLFLELHTAETRREITATLRDLGYQIKEISAPLESNGDKAVVQVEAYVPRAPA